MMRNANIKARIAKLPKWLRITLFSFFLILILLILAWVGLSWFISNNKEKLLATITEKISEHMEGELTIEDMEPALLDGFPNISVRLANVKLKDSLFHEHKKYTINLQSVYVKLNILSFFTSHPQIRKVTLSDGELYLFKQKDAYSNTYLFQKKDTLKTQKKDLDFHAFAIKDVVFTFDNFLRNKQFKVGFEHMEGNIYPKEKLWDITARTDAFIYQLGFNLDKGGYLVNKTLKANLRMTFYKETKRLELPTQIVTVEDIPIRLAALFNFKAIPAAFDLDLNVSAINFTRGIYMLPRNISRKLDSISIAKDISAHALIKGTFQFPDTPYVNIFFDIENNTIETPFGTIKKANLKPEFNNHVYPGKGRSDNNTAITMAGFSGEWEGIPLYADTVAIYNLWQPLLTTKVHSKFPVEKLNNIVGSSFSLKKGSAGFDIFYEGPVTLQDLSDYRSEGYVKIEDAAITYVPRGLQFQNCNAMFRLDKKKLVLQKVSLSSQKSTIDIHGTIENFLNTFLNDPSKAVFDWKINSSSIDLNEFKTLLNPRSSYTASPTSKNRKIRKLNQQLDDVLAKSTMLLDVNIQKVNYRKFNAHHIKGKVTLEEVGIHLNNMSLAHAGGTIKASGNVRQSHVRNPFNIKANIKNVKVDQLFYAFEDFGQETIKDENLEGSFSADINMSGELTENISLVNNAFNGSINFELKNGELNNFPPFLAISKFIFKNRNLDHITFETLKNRLDIKNGKVNIPPMQINSSAIRMEVEGVYAFKSGTDIALKIPLRNPEKDKRRLKQGLEARRDRGFIVYLRAKDGDDGKVHIGWDPLKKGQPNQGTTLFSDQDTNFQDTFFVK